MQGNKEDQGKTMYQLVPAYAHEQIARVFTYGYNKYNGEEVDLRNNNWTKGIKWSKLMGALERHYQSFKVGIDVDPESGLWHLAHAGANIMMLLDFIRSHPELDDRVKPYMNTRKIVLDVDDVVADFSSAYAERFGNTNQNYWDFSYKLPKNLEDLVNSEEGESFFVNLPIKHRPNFIPHAYVSSRSVPVEWTEKFLEKNGLPCRPVHHVPFGASKIEKLKALGDDIIFIDDKIENFLEAEKAGMTAYLMDAKHNQYINVGYRRLFDLDIQRIVR